MIIKCPQTKEKFRASRSNQKYINSDARILYNNEKARKKRMIKKDVDFAINTNWNILLKQLADKERVQRSEQFMLGAGFDFNFYQRAYKVSAGIMNVIYNCGYIINNERVILFKL